MPCLSDETVAAFAQGTLPPHARTLAEHHIDNCRECADLVAELAMLFAEESPPGDPGPGNQPPATDYPLAPGTTISRYVITRVVGSGSGGVVYEAYDPQLRRRASVKLVRPGPEGHRHTDEFRRRLLHEAQAMARLSHPNVVTVHDVGLFEGQVYMVLELAVGEALTVWLRRQPRTWREILRVFDAAGRGLAAAHAARIVHHDFKPDNVIVGTDGRVRLTDFGLARPTGEDPPTASARTAETPGETPAGTPAFMAPEQFQLGRDDARSDQFAFCVALYWALFGRHPLRRRGESSDAGLDAADVAAADAGDVPANVQEALARGLQLNAQDRFAGMNDLLAALTPATAIPVVAAAPARTRSRRLQLSALMLVVGASVMGWLLWRRFREAPQSAAPPAAVAPVPPEVRPPSSCAAAVSDFGGPMDVPALAADGGCFVGHGEPLDWQGASEACASRGGYLAACTTFAECAALAAVAGSDRPYWIGPRSTDADTVRTVTGLEVPPPLARALIAGDTNVVPPGGGCLVVDPAVRPGKGQRTWSFRACNQRLPYVCQNPFWLVDVAGGHAYRIFHAASSFDHARRNCEALGARLVTITSAAEENFLEAQFRDTPPYQGYWIGATDVDQEGVFRWLDGEPFQFTAFQKGEPNDQDGDQDCLFLNRTTLRWHDRNCTVKYPALCESDRRPRPRSLER